MGSAPACLYYCGMTHEHPGPVRASVDPAGTLPEVELTLREPNYLRPDSFDYDIVHRGRAVGSVTLGAFGPNELGFSDIAVQGGPDKDNPDEHDPESENFRGRGIGLAAHVLAIEMTHAQGKAFVSDVISSRPIVKIWQRLVAAGIAQEVEPFHRTRDDPDRFIGEYRVPPRSSST